MKKEKVEFWMFLLTFLYNHPMLAQEYSAFVQEGKMWETEVVAVSNSQVSRKYTEYINGDTIINGKKWKKVYSNNCQQNFLYYAALHEEGKKVYVIYDGETDQKLLYDFNLNVGDVVYRTNGSSGHYLLESVDGYTGWYSTMTLKSIDYICVNERLLRRLTFTSRWIEKSLSTYPNLVWVEGIGSEGGPFLPWSKHTPDSRVCCMIDGVMIFEDDAFYADGIETGVQSITAPSPQSSTAFDLQGRPVAKQRRGEIYVTKGRKVIGE